MNIEVPSNKDTLKFSRSELPQIKGAHIPYFISWLKKNGIKAEAHKIKASELKATQNEFNKEKVKALMHKPETELKPSISSNDGYILDGHHRWLADHNKNVKHDTIKIDLPIHALIKKAHSYDKSFTKTINEMQIRALTVKRVLREDAAYRAPTTLTDFAWIDHNNKIVWPKAGDKAHWQLSRRAFPSAGDNSVEHALDKGWTRLYHDDTTAIVQYRKNRVDYRKGMKTAVAEFLKNKNIPRENIVYIDSDDI